MLSELWKSLSYPSEIASMIQLKRSGSIREPPKKDLAELAGELSSIDFSYACLHKVSRSFAVVIQQLNEELKDAICIFYLVLRGLDSVEDDMDYPAVDKIPMLRSFYLHLEEDGWNLPGVGDSPDYKKLMGNFHKIIDVYKSLKPGMRGVISNITKLMGNGMADFVQKTQETGKGSVTNVEEYNLYCHYVAGLVGIGLTDLFAASGLEAADLNNSENLKLANSMGLFLQKTNIIRDYLEDLDQARTWWPEEIWSVYAPSLDWFAKNPDSETSRAVLNHMVCDAFSLVPDVLSYLSLLKEKSIYTFCAIPQVMAIATLVEVYNNLNTMKGVVKIRKGISCEIMLNCSDMAAVNGYFQYFATVMARKIELTTNKDAELDSLVSQNLKRLKAYNDDILVRTSGCNAPSYSWGSVFVNNLSIFALLTAGVAASVGFYRYK